MSRRSNVVYGSLVQPYNEKQYVPIERISIPRTNNTIAELRNTQQYPLQMKNAIVVPQQPIQAVPIQNYRVSATSPIRVSQAVLQPQVIASQSRPMYFNANPNTRVSYDINPNVVGVAIPQPAQNVVRTTMVPVTQYVPVEVVEPAPVIAVSPPLGYYGQPSRVSQRVIVDQPQIYEKREIKYVQPAKVAAATKNVAQQPKSAEYNDPMVQTVRNTFDASSVRASRVAPPPAKAQETPCATWLLALLGLLGLIGLILAIVLSQNSKNSTTVQSSSPTVSNPQKVGSVAPSPVATKIAPTQDLTNAQVQGQTVVTAPTPVPTQATTTQTVATVTPPKPTDISVTQPAAVNTQTTVLSGVQPQSISPTYVSTSQPSSTSSASTSTTNTATSSTQPGTVQPVLTPGTQASTNSTNTTTSTSNSTQPTSVQPTTTNTTTQPSTVQPTQVDSIPATTASTTTTTSVTTTTTPSHFLTLRHHL